MQSKILKLLTLLFWVMTAGTNIALSKTAILGEQNCDINDPSTLTEYGQNELETAWLALDYDVTVLKVTCIKTIKHINISLNRPDLSIVVQNSSFDKGYSLSHSSLRSFESFDMAKTSGNIEIYHNSVLRLYLDRFEVEGSLSIKENVIKGSLILGDPIYIAGTQTNSLTVSKEIAVYLNEIGGILHLGSINNGPHESMPFIFGNTLNSLFIGNSTFKCDKCTDRFSIYRNDIRDAIHINNTSIEANIQISGSTLNSIDIRDSKLKALSILGQKIRDVYIYSNNAASEMEIDKVHLDDSNFSYLKFHNIKSKMIDCTGCIISETASFSGNISEIELKSASVKGAIDIGNVEIGDKNYPSRISLVKLKNTISPLIVFDNIINKDEFSIDWNSHRVNAIGFAETVKNPDISALNIAQATDEEAVLRLISRYFEKSEKNTLAKNIKYKIQSNRFWNSDDFFIWKYTKLLLGGLIGFGYYYQNLLFVCGFLTLVGAFLYRKNTTLIERKSLQDGFFYSLDALVPALNFDKEYSEVFTQKRVRMYFYFVKIFGFIAVALILADLSNVFAF